jgi:O-antigen/teichoic acid export membrane protein
LYVAARLVNMVLGFAMIPLLIHSLGGQGFAAWAILLSCSAVFNELQLGMHGALVREVAVADRAQPDAVARLWASTVAFLVAVHAALLPVIVLAARPLAEWLRLPRVGPWHPGVAILIVFVAVAARSALITGAFALFASTRFYQAVAVSLGQALVSNATATVVAWHTRDLAATLVAFWTAQLVVLGIGFAAALSTGWRLRPALVSGHVIRRLLAYGVRVQLAEWAQIINFQFDKFVIVRVLGLWPAALYEVSNRSVLALRSIPASGMETFLPVITSRASSGQDAHADPRRMALLALNGVLVFFAAPLVVAPVFLYAWVGEMGYVSRHVFAFLILGASANLLALPLAALCQAAGRPQVQARAAIASILLNVPLSLTLVRLWGLEGAALGSSLAMVLGMAVLLREARVALGRDVVSVVTRTLVRHWPLALVCLVWGLAVHVGFDRWLDTTSVPVRYMRSQRAVAGLVALGLYAGCLLTLAVFKVRLVGLEDDERQSLARLAAMLHMRVGTAAPTLGRPAAQEGVGPEISHSRPPDAPA